MSFRFERAATKRSHAHKTQAGCLRLPRQDCFFFDVQQATFLFLRQCRFSKNTKTAELPVAHRQCEVQRSRQSFGAAEYNRRALMRTYENCRQAIRNGSCMTCWQRKDWRCCRNSTQGRLRRNTRLEHGGERVTRERGHDCGKSANDRAPANADVLLPEKDRQIVPQSVPKKSHQKDQFKNHVSRGAKQSGNFSGNPAAAFPEHEIFLWSVCVLLFFEHFFGIEFRALLVPDSCQFWCRAPTHHSSHICLARKPPCSYFTDVYLSANST